MLITANVGLLALILATRGVGEGGGLIRFLSPSSRALFDFGARVTPAIQYGQIWRLVTAIYLHAGLLHLLFNSMALHSLGTLIEEAFGGRRLFAIYTVSGVAGFAVSTWIGGHPASVGASGAIFGLLGFAFVYGRYRGGPAGRAIADHLMTWLVYAVLMSMTGGVDYWAHGGGFVAGGALGLVLAPGDPRTRRDERLWKAANAGFVLLTLASFAAMVAAQFATRGA
jgi:rhomboid protease GluP